MSVGPSPFLPNAELEAQDSRFLRLFSEALDRFSSGVLPVRSVRTIRLRTEHPRGFVGLTTYSAASPEGWQRPPSVVNATQTITFYTNMLYQLSDEAVQAVMVHELAHAWLNEHVSPEESKEREREADELAAKWGFTTELEALDQEADSI